MTVNVICRPHSETYKNLYFLGGAYMFIKTYILTVEIFHEIIGYPKIQFLM